MAKLKFLFKPQNELEKRGRKAAPLYGEPEKTCPNCHRTLTVKALEETYGVCSCGYHFRMGARERLDFIADEGSFYELFKDIRTSDPLSFPGYQEKLRKAESVSGGKEAVITGTCTIKGEKCAIFIMDSLFMMGSMGAATGEKITRLFEYALGNDLPVVGFTVSGGARMQEGMLSLMQMAATSGAVRRHSDKGLFYLTVLTDPTTGGVTASFAMEGDIIIAEPGATIGFAGARVVEQTTRQPLPKGFQTSESMLEHGFVDAIVERKDEKEMIRLLLAIHRRADSERI